MKLIALTAFSCVLGQAEACLGLYAIDSPIKFLLINAPIITAYYLLLCRIEKGG